MTTTSKTLTPTPWRVGNSEEWFMISIWAANGVRVCTLGAADWDRENAERIVAAVNAAAAEVAP